MPTEKRYEEGERCAERLHVVAVDDEALALRDLCRALEAELPAGCVHPFSTSHEALEHVRKSRVDAVFCDIEMPGMNGIVFAKAVKDVRPETHIVFVTSYESYTLDAFALHATGYLLKPVEPAELRRELTFIYEHPASPAQQLEVTTFGGFEVRLGGEPLVFKRSKTKELFALLVDRQGAGVSAREACDALWEGEPYTASQRSYYQTIVADLRATLERAGMGGVIVKAWNSLAIVPDLIDCDLYRFMAGDPLAINSYRGSYLPAYSWAEFSIGAIERTIYERG